ncbi:inositol phospholipid synthesis and fat-storage-inducing TM-domain-containing protein [Tricharina praecox]|uniref:inositol phospholipid synthesis and fat-storage-inducing TM-domain-containing protein n=1 Tax=Tricharina praecox TaxID=43433 RepID=UPI0022205577|nr:inositol phospholipid synthesis and fat-storage-inducing TM-domain-containing protein [Tricharina praecox]KAI5853473.1 inositol phospholipid synthesis and fat-storage-inducing TM-domain-containing protein [Tricharina praecox]
MISRYNTCAMNPSPSPFEKSPTNGFTREKDDAEPEPSFRMPQAYGHGIHSSTNEYLVALIYPATLALASAFYLLSPSPSANESYFSHKGNLINVVFVKFGWFWTTAVFLLHLSRLRSSSKPKALLRWVLATVWWISVTQWFFGPPLMDRTFLITGGACEVLHKANADPNDNGMSKGGMLLTSAACKLQGGRWTGGHDLSGHVFLLTHASLFLWSEVLPVLSTDFWGGVESGAVWGLLGMWWWMLLMTGVYFHTWTEKITGLVVATFEWAALYMWALKSLPNIRMLLGVPGV